MSFCQRQPTLTMARGHSLRISYDSAFAWAKWKWKKFRVQATALYVFVYWPIPDIPPHTCTQLCLRRNPCSVRTSPQPQIYNLFFFYFLLTCKFYSTHITVNVGRDDVVVGTTLDLHVFLLELIYMDVCFFVPCILFIKYAIFRMLVVLSGIFFYSVYVRYFELLKYTLVIHTHKTCSTLLAQQLSRVSLYGFFFSVVYIWNVCVCVCINNRKNMYT